MYVMGSLCIPANAATLPRPPSHQTILWHMAAVIANEQILFSAGIVPLCHLGVFASPQVAQLSPGWEIRRKNYLKYHYH